MDIEVDAGPHAFAENRNGIPNIDWINVSGIEPGRPMDNNANISFGQVGRDIRGGIHLSQEALIALSTEVLEAYGYTVTK